MSRTHPRTHPPADAHHGLSGTACDGDVARHSLDRVKPCIAAVQRFVSDVQERCATAQEQLTAAAEHRAGMEAQLAAAERDRSAAAAESVQRRAELAAKDAELAALQEHLAALSAQLEQHQARERREAEERALAAQLAAQKDRLDGDGAGSDGEDAEGDLVDSLNVSTVPVQRGRGGGSSGGRTVWTALERVWGMLQAAGSDRDDLQTQVLVPRTLGNYALHERVGGAPDEVVVRATKLRTGAPCALKWVPCGRFVSATAAAAAAAAVDKSCATPGAAGAEEEEVPPEAYAVFVEPYILSHVVHEAVVPLVGTVECTAASAAAAGTTASVTTTTGAGTATDNLVRDKWMARLQARGPCFLLELRWLPDDLQHAAATGGVGPAHAPALAARLFGALAHLHACGVVHRAVAPWHVRVPGAGARPEAAGAAVLAGFGAACTPASDAALVPPLPAAPGSYAAPELFADAGSSISISKTTTSTAFWAACDTWAAACVVLEVLLDTRARPLFCPRILRALAHGGAAAAAALAQPGTALHEDYPVLQWLAPADESGGSSNNSTAGARVDAARVRAAMPAAVAADARAGRLAELLCRVLVTDPGARPTAAAVAAQAAELCGRPAPSAGPHAPAPWAPATLPALRRFARRHCGFLFK